MIIVDKPRDRGWRLGPNSHLISTLPGLAGTEELLAFSKRIHLREGWIQHRGGPQEHFDLTTAKHAWALRLGAKLVDRGAFVSAIRLKRGDQ